MERSLQETDVSEPFLEGRSVTITARRVAASSQHYNRKIRPRWLILYPFAYGFDGSVSACELFGYQRKSGASVEFRQELNWARTHLNRKSCFGEKLRGNFGVAPS